MQTFIAIIRVSFRNQFTKYSETVVHIVPGPRACTKIGTHSFEARNKHFRSDVVDKTCAKHTSGSRAIWKCSLSHISLVLSLANQ